MNDQFFVRRLALIVICATVGGVAGCGGGNGALKGTVTFQGKPVVVGAVTVFASDGMVLRGAIQSDGSYEVGNITPGPAKVTVYSPDNTQLTGLELLRAKGKADPGGKPDPDLYDGGPRYNPPGWMPLPTKFMNVETTDLAVQVTGDIVSYDISLK